MTYNPSPEQSDHPLQTISVINRADAEAAAQTGYPALFYSIKRRFGDKKARIYLKLYDVAQTRPTQ